MCRLFGLLAAQPVAATFWLLDAPDSLAVQSRADPDGAGIGVFDVRGHPHVDKQPIAAWADPEFATAARTLRSTSFVAHVRYASTGARTPANTHPFTQDGRVFAHNGAFSDLPALDRRLAELGAARLAVGQTDSERLFSLITAETRLAGGDVGTGLRAAVRWVADALPVYSLNLVLTTDAELWALRYPAANELHVLRRPAGGVLRADTPRITAHSDDLRGVDAVVVASEPMDDDTRWRPLEPGELLHVGSDGAVSSSAPFGAPRHPLDLHDLEPATAASQRPGGR